ncbi:MAG: mandelate racemase/muconate lactonizing enzyme family protein [Alphaproteobacteria bacterium]|jgi:L-alanine-DL-glutamate epimerase-like enolase superfamily enzyme|nr:mandelate racemase/muconate lactonizing enzyme family protein [Alphaproteobacteria bacterium]
MKIKDLAAYPVSFPIPADKGVTLGIGRAVKRDAVLVRIETESGLVGWGEAHAGRAPGAVAQLANTTLKTLIDGMAASDVVGVWDRVYKMQLASHGMGAAAAIALSGIDMALWDIRAKAVGWPLYRLLGGAAKPIPAYAGGVSLGYQPPDELVAEARHSVEAGYRALKLRLGDTAANDIARVEAVRQAFGDELDILTDANAAYTLADVRRVMPALDAAGVGWLEEPFPPHDHRRYSEARSFGVTPLAAGENHYTRFEFHRLIEDGLVTIVQPDLSKTGGITEGLRIAALASAWKLSINPHTSLTGLNVAATIHLLCAIDNAGYFEADISAHNPFRDQLCSWQAEVDGEGNVHPPEAPGLGVEIDEKLLAEYPLIDGPGYV